MTGPEMVRLLTNETEAALLAEGYANPLPEDRMRRLLTKSIERMRESAGERGDVAILAALSDPTEEIVERIISKRRIALNQRLGNPLVAYGDDRAFVQVEYDNETVLVGIRFVDRTGYACAMVGGVMRGDAWSARMGGCPADTPEEQALRHVWEEGFKVGDREAYGFFTGGRSLKYLVHSGCR